MMKTTKSLTSLALILALMGCVSNLSIDEQQTAPLADSMLCCTAFADFPWVQLGKKEKLTFQINNSSPVGKFVEGNSYFNAFKLPKQAKRVHIRLASKMLNGTVFAPKLIALDENFNLVEFRDLDSFELTAANDFSRNEYLLNLMLDAERTPYFIIYTKADMLGKTVQVEHPAKIRAKQFGELIPSITDPQYVYSHFGELSLRVAVFTLGSFQEMARFYDGRNLI